MRQEGEGKEEVEGEEGSREMGVGSKRRKQGEGRRRERLGGVGVCGRRREEGKGTTKGERQKRGGS